MTKFDGTGCVGRYTNGLSDRTKMHLKDVVAVAAFALVGPNFKHLYWVPTPFAHL